MKKNKDVEKLSVGRLPPELDKLVSNLIRLDRKHHREELPGVNELKDIIGKSGLTIWEVGGVEMEIDK